MASKETLIERGHIALGTSAFLRDPENADFKFDGPTLNEDREFAVVPAAAYESMAVTLHRIQKTGQRFVILATRYEGMGRLIELHCNYETTPGEVVTDLPGRTTVQDWFDTYGDDSNEEIFTCNGSEFAMEINGIAATSLIRA